MKQANDRARVEIGMIAPHARHGALVDVSVIAAAIAAVPSAGGATGGQHGGEKAGGLGCRTLDQAFRPLRDAQIAQRPDQMAPQRAYPFARRWLRGLVGQRRHAHFGDAVGRIGHAGGSVDRYQPSPANQVEASGGGTRVSDRTVSSPPASNMKVNRAAVR